MVKIAKTLREVKLKKDKKRKKISKVFQRDIGRDKKQYYNDIYIDIEDRNRQGK